MKNRKRVLKSHKIFISLVAILLIGIVAAGYQIMKAEESGTVLGNGISSLLKRTELDFDSLSYNGSSMVYYNQKDFYYEDKTYGTDSINMYGCGPAAMAMLVSTFTDEETDIEDMAQWAYENGYWCSESGSYHTIIQGGCENFNLNCESLDTDSSDELVQALNDGKLIVALMKEGHFTKGGHFIILRGIDEDGGILVADPASRERSVVEWDVDIIMDEINKNASGGGPLWAIWK